MVGFVTLFGIMLSDSIMLISNYDMSSEGQQWNLDTVVRGAGERLTRFS